MWLDRLLGEWGIPKDGEAGRAEFERRMEARRAAEDGVEFKPVVRGCCLGGEEFREELLARMSREAGPEHYGMEIRESGLAKAERIIREELKRGAGRWRTWTSGAKAIPRSCKSLCGCARKAR